MGGVGNPKSGGRAKGVKNKPKPPAPSPEAAVARPPPGAGGGGRAAPAQTSTPRTRTPAREAGARATPRVFMKPVAELVAFKSNARVHPAAQITKLAAAIREFGFTVPVLTDGRNGIIAGHGRVMAAKQLGMVEVPAMSLAHLTPKQRRAYVISENRIPEDAKWDRELLAIEMGEMRELNFDLALTGFDDLELDGLGLGDEQPTEEPKPREKVVTTQEATCPKCGHAFRV